MSITSDLIRGHTDTIILAHLSNHDSYGYQVNKHIKEITDGTYEFKEATLYSAFRRLEKDGFVKSYWGDAQTGARRRYYKITPLGKTLLAENRKEWEKSKRLIDLMIAEGN